MTGRVLAATEFGNVLHDFEHTAFRLELQPSYLEAEEAGLLAAFLRGDPEPPTTVGGLREWYDRIAQHVKQGKRIERVRVQEEPPTDYQRFERWLDRWNLRAGETMRYMTRQRAHEVGLLPAAGTTDWWLLDSSRLIVMHFDDEGHRIHNELVTDPAVVIQACTWRDLAVHHSDLAQSQDAAA
ncbi:hypothetical protein OG589_14335 [Sphaerisporangium sp. NBC_01403]|uniref:DUF6879 family protein n=1 Tax=Sphaerisporangium sp. NBC_01403 TaxID=2903599 RepID=UPI0032462390